MLKSLILTFEITVPTTFPFMQFFSFFDHYDSSDGLAYNPKTRVCLVFEFVNQNLLNLRCNLWQNCTNMYRSKIMLPHPTQ